MEIVNATAQQYAEKYTTPQDLLLQEVLQFSLQHPESQMVSGFLQGQFLAMISRMLRPARILEIGTFTGYSALCLAAGLQPGGKLHTLELREREVATAKGYFDRSPYREQIIIHIGDALEKIGEIQEIWDLVFIDADKVNYIHYFNRVLPKVKQNGFILADNTLFHGQVLEKEIKGKNAVAIQAFNDHILNSAAVEKVMLPLRDGLYLMRKL
jgi:caffeoyl-CoA O-methyltransferase